MQSDTYNSIAALSEGLFRDNGSRFLAFAYPVESEQEVKLIVDKLKKEYHDARHHCYAYRIGLNGEKWRANDDGEPSGSAGRQILGQIDSAGLSDVLVVVVRYFGGILLGIPGLIRAYKTSTADALQKATKIQKTASVSYRIKFKYEALPAVMKILKDANLPQKEQNFDMECTLTTTVPLGQEKDFLQRTENLVTLEQVL